jgi:hypothetical protein
MKVLCENCGEWKEGDVFDSYCGCTITLCFDCELEVEADRQSMEEFLEETHFEEEAYLLDEEGEFE